MKITGSPGIEGGKGDRIERQLNWVSETGKYMKDCEGRHLFLQRGKT
jgi:hypothetical protein